MTKKEITNLVQSLNKLGLTKQTLFKFAKGLNVIEHLGYAKALEVYMECKYDLVEFYSLKIEDEDEVCCALDTFIFDIVATSLRLLGLVLQNYYEDFKDEDELFVDATEAYYIFPNDDAFANFFEEHRFCVYRLDCYESEKIYYMLYDRELRMFYRNHLESDCVSFNAVKESIEELFELLEDEFFEDLGLDRDQTFKDLSKKVS